MMRPFKGKDNEIGEWKNQHIYCNMQAENNQKFPLVIKLDNYFMRIIRKLRFPTEALK